jgi:riboflavin kinase / FMN adenylyltransferase
MLIVTDISEVPATDRPVVLAMGCFDGVHLGHQRVITTAVEQAAERGGQAWVYTFDPHPAKVLCPGKAPPLISAAPCRRRQFEVLGVDGVIEIPFDTTYAQTAPEEFLDNLKQGLASLSGIVSGADWSFGYKAGGTFQTLETFCARHGMTAVAIHPVLFGGQKISSTQIRKAVAEGNIPLAEQMLGHPFSLFGPVVTGRKIGRELGYPTANIEPLNELIPASGVYAAYTKVQSSEFGVQGSEFGVQGSGHPSAVFIGAGGTSNHHEPVIESHLLDFDGDLYGQSIEICLIEKTRDVQPFPSKDELIAQIALDIQQIRTILAS